jgi:putative Holliday junction resolvase
MPDRAPPRGFILSFDFGYRRIGVAVGQLATRTASVLETVPHHAEPDWNALDRIIAEWKPGLFVVGLPVALDGTESEMSKAARKFGNKLQERYQQECIYADERLSSRAAQERFADLRATGGLKRKHARQLDSIAAQIILESWMQTLPAEPL